MNRSQRRHAEPKKSRMWMVWLGLIILLIIAGVVYTNTKGTGVDYTQYTYTDEKYASPEATVVIEEFSDFECPYCQQLAPTIRAIRDARTDVRIIYKQYPLRTIHPNAQAAAEASECARVQNKFWAYHDVLFESQKLDKRSLKKHAQGLGLDMNQWNTCLESGEAKAKVSQDMLEGTQRQVSGTPTLFLNGQVFSGRTVSDFNSAITNAKER